MKLLLTSSGLRNKRIAAALKDMVGKPASETKIVFIPTAANVEGGSKDWYVNQLLQLWRFGYNWVDIVDPSAADVKDWKERLDAVDVIFVSGGNTFHLLEQARATGLADWLKGNIEHKVYVGSSAGSILATPTIGVGGVGQADRNINDLQDLTALGFVDFEVIPHAFRMFSEEAMQAYAASSPHSVYAIDDTSAVKVVGDTVEVVSEVYWKLYEK